MRTNPSEKLLNIILILLIGFFAFVAVKSTARLLHRCKLENEESAFAIAQSLNNAREKEITSLLDNHLGESVSADFPDGAIQKPIGELRSVKGIRHHAPNGPGHVTDTLFYRAVKITASFDPDDPSDRTDYIVIQYLWTSQEEPEYIEIYGPADLPGKIWRW